MTSGELKDKLPFLLRADISATEVTNLEKYLFSELLEDDKETKKRIKETLNKAKNIKLLKKISLEKYGRDMDIQDSLPISVPEEKSNKKGGLRNG